MNPPMVTCSSLPSDASSDTIYRLEPSFDPAYYRNRTDRNLGWITELEQDSLRNAVVGIAGCGGMGGLISLTLVRLGVGEIRIADSEVFDESNINRQFAAGRSTVGKSKAFETARMIRDISDDTTVVVYPQGIQPDTVDSFLDGCDIVCDEIEFWAVGARILLHRAARPKGICLFTCSSVGFGTRLLYFKPNGYTMEQLLGLTYEEAVQFQSRFQSKQASAAEIRSIMHSLLTYLVPEVPEYGAYPESWSTVANADARLFQEGRAMIISTNPPFASGFLSNHVLMHLLRTRSALPRNLPEPPEAPSYLYLDAGFHLAKIVNREDA